MWYVIGVLRSEVNDFPRVDMPVRANKQLTSVFVLGEYGWEESPFDKTQQWGEFRLLKMRERYRCNWVVLTYPGKSPEYVSDQRAFEIFLEFAVQEREAAKKARAEGRPHDASRHLMRTWQTTHLLEDRSAFRGLLEELLAGELPPAVRADYESFLADVELCEEA